MFSKLQSLMNSQAETSEDHSNPLLRTHYFKGSKEAIIAYLAEIVKEDKNYRALGDSAERGEITFDILYPKKAFAVITAVTFQGRHTAVDINVTAESALPFQYAHCERMAVTIYQLLKEKFELIGTGLAENYQ
ncbi:hypothetical protein ACFFJY_06405 [Fictibacillus aquaticus]|uniref:Cytosolic protein n=1 Tax=Fictibacillus aquaticus TaxID=2021314 RepID=A0A235FBL5_9BACL|nr:hypothetical protein [Fictibacillus aquaticus]OYD58165.1 hypothetical protein CGZ90_09800 [Fictibacillus aquaticus]